MTFSKAKIWKCHFFVVPLQAKSEATQGNFRGASEVS